MAAVTIRNLPDETHRALRVRAAKNGRSTEAEIRAILEEVARPAERIKVGSELAAFGAKFNIDLAISRNDEPVRAAIFE